MTSKLRTILLALTTAGLAAACSHEQHPHVVGPVLGQSTAMGPSDPTRPPPPPTGGAIAGGPSQSIRGVGNAPITTIPAPASAATDTSGSDNAIANGSTPDTSNPPVVAPVTGMTPAGTVVAPPARSGSGSGTTATGPTTGAGPNGPGTGTGPATPTGPATGAGTPTPGTGTGAPTGPGSPTPAPGTTGSVGTATSLPNPGGGTSTPGGSGR